MKNKEMMEQELIKDWNEMEEVNSNSSKILNNNMLKKLSSIIKSLDIETNEKNNLIFDFELQLSKADSEEINKKIMFIKRKISELEDESNQFQNNSLNNSQSRQINGNEA